jgi:hypothetical protein
MLSGMNTETEYQGKTYHIQTEDGGRKNPVITTQLFFKGAILFTQKTSYGDIIKAQFLEDIVRDMMKQQHTQVIKDLVSGRLLEKKPVQAQPSAAPPSAKSPQVESKSAPPQKQERTQKSLDDLILDYLVSKKEKEG